MADFKWPFGAPYVGKSWPIAIDCHAQVAQSVEHVLGKDEVSGSIPLLGFAFRIGEFGEGSSWNLAVSD